MRGVAALSGGQILAAIVPLFSAPILGRLYLPSDYGVLGAYLAVSGVLASVGNWQYAQGIVVEKRDSNALVLLQLCFFTSLLTSLVSMLIGLAIFCYPAQAAPSERIWFLLLPLSTFIGGVNGSRVALANRYRRYSKLATVQVAATIISVGLSIGMGFAGFGYSGLLIAYFASQILVFVIYLRLTASLPRLERRPSYMRQLAMARKHKEFALFTTPGAFVGNFAMQLPIFALGFLGAVGTIGLFSRARQLLGMPIALVGTSIAQVFKQQAAADYARAGNCNNIFRKTFFALAGIGILPTIVLAILAPQLFEVFLGKNWRGAGEIARVLAPMLYLRLVCGPLSTVFMIVGAQKEDFVLSVATLFLLALAVGVPLIFEMGTEWIVAGFSAAYCIVYMVYIFRGHQLSRC